MFNISKIFNNKNINLNSQDKASLIKNENSGSSVSIFKNNNKKLPATNMEGFEEIFTQFGQDRNLVQKVNLDNNQKKLLLQKINETEQYKNENSDIDYDKEKSNTVHYKYAKEAFDGKTEIPKLQEQLKTTTNEAQKNEILEKIDNYQWSGKIYSEFSTFDQMKEKYNEKWKNGDFSDMTNEELAQLLDYTDTTDFKADGKIGSFNQGMLGDCWFLSQLSNYSQTEDGAKNLADRISENSDGSYTVTLQNPTDISKEEKYIITKEELNNTKGEKFSTGDTDVRLYEIAMNRMLYKYLVENTDNNSIKNLSHEGLKQSINFEKEKAKNDSSNSAADSYILGEGYTEKQILVHKALGYDSEVTRYSKNTDEGILGYQNVPSSQMIKQSIDISKNEQGKTTFSYKYEAIDKSFAETIADKDASELYVVRSDINKADYSNIAKEKVYQQGGHVYNLVQKNEDGSVVVQDPYNSNFLHTISKEDFEKPYSAFTYIPKK